MAAGGPTSPTRARGGVRHVAPLRPVPGGSAVEVAPGDVLRLRPASSASPTGPRPPRPSTPVGLLAAVTRRPPDGRVPRGANDPLARTLGRFVGMVVLLLLWARLVLRDGDPAATGVLVFVVGWVAMAVAQDRRGARDQARSR